MQVDLIAAGAEADAGAGIGAELYAIGGGAAEPVGDERRLGCFQIGGFEESDGLARTDRGDAGRSRELLNCAELSSVRRPVVSIAVRPLLVTSNQSAATGLLPLEQRATSEMNSVGAVASLAISVTSST